MLLLVCFLLVHLASAVLPFSELFCGNLPFFSHNCSNPDSVFYAAPSSVSLNLYSGRMEAFSWTKTPAVDCTEGLMSGVSFSWLESWDPAVSHDNTIGAATKFCYQPGTLNFPLPCTNTSGCVCNCFDLSTTLDLFCGALGICSQTYRLISFGYEPLPAAPRPVPMIVSVSCTHDADGIYCQYEMGDQVFLMVSRGSWNVFVEGNETSATVYYNTAAKGISAYVYLSVLMNGQVVSSQSWWEPGQSYCDLIGGWICCNRNHLTCQAFYSPYWWIFLVVFLVVILALFVPCVYVLLAAVFGFIWYGLMVFLKSPIWLYRKFKPKPKLNYSMLGLFLLPLALGCTEVLDPVGSTMVCDAYIENGVHYEDCALEFSSAVILPYIKSSACASIVDVLGNTLGDIEITYTSASATLQTVAWYYTSGWQAFSESSKRCWGAGACEDDFCEEILPTDSTAGHEFMNPLVTTWPGYTSCDASCGCAGCGCFYCRDGCLFSRVSVVPNSTDVYKVSQPVQIVYRPTVSVKVNIAGVTQAAYAADIETEAEVGPFVISLDGVFAGSMTSFGSNVFICSQSGRCKYGFASPQGSPIAGAVGDLQATSADYPFNPSVDSFIFPWESFRKNVQETKVVYSAPNVGLQVASHYPDLPVQIGETVWSYSEGVFSGIAKDTGALHLSIRTSTPVSFTSKVGGVCPDIVFVNGTGCFDCMTPASLLFKGRSLCGPGTVPVTVPSPYEITTPAVTLSNSDVYFRVDMFTPVQDVDCTVSFGDFQVSVSFIAVEFIDFQDDTFDIVNSTVNSHDDVPVLHLFAKWFPSLPDWLAILLDIVLLLCIIVVFCLVVWLLVKLIKHVKHKQE